MPHALSDQRQLENLWSRGPAAPSEQSDSTLERVFAFPGQQAPQGRAAFPLSLPGDSLDLGTDETGQG